MDGRPVVLVYQVSIIDDPLEMTKRWREYAIAEGIGDLYLIVLHVFGFQGDPRSIGFDAALEFPPNTFVVNDIANQVEKLNPAYQGRVYDYGELASHMSKNRASTDYLLFKTIMPSWDNTARKSDSSTVFLNASPARFQSWLSESIQYTLDTFSPPERFVFINAWNEWAEGTHLEPDRRYGYAHLQSIANALKEYMRRSKNLKILFVSHDANPGGAQLILVYIVQWLKNNSTINLKVLCLDDGKLLSSFENAADTLIYKSIEHLSLKEQTKALLDFCEGTPNLIYGNTVVAGKVYPWLSKLGVPILTHVHELEFAIRQYASDYIKDVLKFSNDYIACSSSVRQNLIQNYRISPENLYSAHEFINLSGKELLSPQEKLQKRQYFGLERDKFLVFGCGIGMPFRKGADLFIEAALWLRKCGIENFHFYWIGVFDENYTDPQYGVWSDFLRKLTEENLQQFVTFLGFIDDPKVFLRLGDIFILSSREDPFPLVMMEAAECGLPVLCFEGSGGGPEFVVEDIGFTVPFEDTQELAAKVKYLMENDEVRQHMGLKARERILSEFTVDHVMPKIMSYCYKAAGKDTINSSIELRNRSHPVISSNSSRNPLVSIIVPNYNHANYLPQRLDSIFSQTYQDFEVILMDDASTDRSKEILERYADRRNVRIILNEENSGSPFKQWLKAIPLAKGEIIWIAESDDICEPDFLETLLPAFNNPEVKLAYCASYAIDSQGIIIGKYSDMDYLTSISPTRWKQSYCIPAEQEINEALGIKNTILNISSVLFRKFEMDDDFKKVLSGMRIGGDSFLILYAIKEGKVYYEARAMNYHRRHSSSIVGEVLTKQDEQKLHSFFQEFYINHIYTARNFRLSPNFPRKVEEYIQELWRTFAPNEPYEEIHQYLPVEDMMKEIYQSVVNERIKVKQ